MAERFPDQFFVKTELKGASEISVFSRVFTNGNRRRACR